jgi:hypothetical protein
MRIFAKKAFRFRGGDKAVTVAALSFADVPEWIKKDPLFALAVKEGSIEIINGKADERNAEKQGTARSGRSRNKNNTPEDDPSANANQKAE